MAIPVSCASACRSVREATVVVTTPPPEVVTEALRAMLTAAM
jgi:hypothetical protein